jgi:tyrosyl-tRNA synthetase
MTLSEELTWRGFVNQTTYSDLTALDGDPITFYWGVDPSAPSMTIGNFAAAMMVRHFIDHGHKAILLVGGATGMIGDPDGKKDERNLQTLEAVAQNKAAIGKQYQRIFEGQSFEIVDNYDWFKDISYMDFLRSTGKHVPLSAMLGRDFVQARLGEGGSGISYAEFSYALIQGYDFLHLYREKGATLQVCGADQWGNSITGVDLIRRVEGAEAHVYSTPLVINKATGVKFGKSEAGAIWLDEALTSVYRFYQFWLNVDDEGVGDYLKIYTLLQKDEHEQLMAEFDQNKAGRAAQKRLAYEVTKLVHGKERADAIVRVTNVLFGGEAYDTLKDTDVALLVSELPVAEAQESSALEDVLVAAHLAQSKSDARRFLQSGGVYVNGQQVEADRVLTKNDILSGGYVIVRRGKNTHALVKITTN